MLGGGQCPGSAGVRDGGGEGGDLLSGCWCSPTSGPNVGANHLSAALPWNANCGSRISDAAPPHLPTWIPPIFVPTRILWLYSLEEGTLIDTWQPHPGERVRSVAFAAGAVITGATDGTMQRRLLTSAAPGAAASGAVRETTQCVGQSTVQGISYAGHHPTLGGGVQPTSTSFPASISADPSGGGGRVPIKLAPSKAGWTEKF